MIIKLAIRLYFLTLVGSHITHKKPVLLNAISDLQSIDPVEFDGQYHSSKIDFFQQERDFALGIGWGECWANTEPKLKCIDGTEWEITKRGGVLSNWDKCGKLKGGRLLCPSTWPYMCHDRYCMERAEQCYTHNGGHGGLRRCTNAPPNYHASEIRKIETPKKISIIKTPLTKAPTISSSNANTCWANTDSKLKCVDGTEWHIAKSGGVLSNWTKCGSRQGGRLLCPSTWPYMCYDMFCMEDAKDCSTLDGGHGGLRPCPLTSTPSSIQPSAPTSVTAVTTSVPPSAPTSALTSAPTLAPKDSALCGGVTCEDVILRFHDPCETTWKQGCGTVPPPNRFSGESTMFDLCPSVCPPACVNLEWESSSKHSCDVYEKKKWCSNGTYGPGWQLQFFGNFSKWADINGTDASHACCACGGGRIVRSNR